VIAQAEGLAQSAASRALGELIEAGHVRRIGTPGRGARYELATEALDEAVDEVP
jgi:DNA-binding IclR family transcriptional regulator